MHNDMNLKKLNAKSVKTLQSVATSQSLSIESMKKVMGGGAYGCHCCVPKQEFAN